MLLKPGMQGYGRKRRRLNNEHDSQTGPCRDFRLVAEWSIDELPPDEDFLAAAFKEDYEE